MSLHSKAVMGCRCPDAATNSPDCPIHRFRPDASELVAALAPQPDPAEAERKALKAMNPFQRQLHIGGSTQAELAGGLPPDRQPVSAEEFERDMRTGQPNAAMEELMAAAAYFTDDLGAACGPCTVRTVHQRVRLRAALARCREVLK